MPGKVRVDDEAAMLGRSPGLDELLGGGERLDTASRGAQRRGQRVARGLVVVDDEDGVFGRRLRATR